MTTDTSEGEWVGAALVPSATIHQSVNHPRNGAPPSAGTESGPAAVSQVAAAENAPHRRQRRQLRGDSLHEQEPLPPNVDAPNRSRFGRTLGGMAYLTMQLFRGRRQRPRFEGAEKTRPSGSALDCDGGHGGGRHQPVL